jgi:PAS domain S-box-containing protein
VEDITERRLMEERLRSLHRYALGLASARDLDQIVNRTLDTMQFNLGFDSAEFDLIEDGLLVVKGDRGEIGLSLPRKIEDAGVIPKAARELRSIRVDDTRKELSYVDRMGPDWKDPPTMLSELATPIVLDGRAVGVLNIEHKQLKAFSEQDQILLENLAAHVASEIKRLEHERQLENYSRELRRSSQFLESIIENANVWLNVLDQRKNVMIWNKAAETISGYSREEVVGHGKVWGWLYPVEEYRNEIIDSLNDIMQKGTVEQDIETTIRRKGGETRVISWNERSLLGEDGKVIGSIAIGRDVTERKLMEAKIKSYSEHLEELVEERTERLAESEARYRRFFESSPISLWEEDFSEVKKYFEGLQDRGIKDLREYLIEHPEEVARCASIVKIVDVNDATLKLYGAKSLDELIGELRRVLANESLDNFREEILGLWEGKTRFASEFKNQTLKGEIRHVSLILTVIPGYEDSLKRVLVSIIDLTERNRIEEELRSAGERLEYIIGSNPAVIYLGKPLKDMSDYYTVYKSKNVASMVGFESNQFMGPDGSAFWASRVHPDDLLKYREGTSKFWEHGHRRCEYRFLHKNGTYRWIMEEANVIRDSTGVVRDIIGYWMDITELKELEQRLLDAEHLVAVGETAAMVGHDLRNPLQGITGALHLLRKESLTKKERDEMLQLIQDSVQYSDAIVRDLTEYSTEIHLQAMETTPKSIIRDAIRTLRVPENINLHDLSEEHPIVTVDQQRMRRVIVNIIENSIDAMPQGGTLTISSKKLDHIAQIALADTGSGMPEKVMRNLWKPLQTTKAKGMGLGLPICKRIVDAHGGTISVDSKAGEGTTVTISLPLTAHVVEMKEK